MNEISLQDWSGRPVFYVSSTPLEADALVRRYYLGGYREIVAEIEKLCRTGPEALFQYLQLEQWSKKTFPSPSTLHTLEGIKGMVVFEALLENQRLKIAPNLPSRLDTTFCWSSRDLAHRYIHEYYPKGVVHSCIVVHGSAVELEGALLPPGFNSLIEDPLLFNKEFKSTMARITKYWTTSNPSKFPESLVLGEVKVLGCEG